MESPWSHAVSRATPVVADKILGHRFNVTGFPTIFVAHKSRTWEHRGPRTRDGLLGLLNRMREPAVKELESAEDLEQLGASGAGGVAFVFGRTAQPHPTDLLFQVSDAEPPKALVSRAEPGPRCTHRQTAQSEADCGRGPTTWPPRPHAFRRARPTPPPRPQELARTRQNLDRFGATAAAGVLAAVSSAVPPFVAKVVAGEETALLP